MADPRERGRYERQRVPRIRLYPAGAGRFGLGYAEPSPGGVYTQSEFRSHNPELAAALDGSVPENIILIDWEGQQRYWVVEAKAKHKDRPKALEEAQGYADAINTSMLGPCARFATGIAGSPDESFYVSTTYWNGTAWEEVVINNYEATGFLSPGQCHTVLRDNSPKILDYDVDLDTFIAKAKAINKTLHDYGVAAKDRARVVAGLLLALAQDSTMTISQSPTTLVGDVNGRIKALLLSHGKADFLGEVQLKLPNTQENHRKYRAAIVQTMQHLREMNVRSAINSGTDALGRFYETFLQYANDAKEMGIVLTPRHITRFAVKVSGVRHEHAIYDPTCGTGGFLVAALDSIRESHYGTHPDVHARFRNDCLYGIEQADDMFGLALVNMIFRGDGKSRIHNGNCFDSRFVRRDGQVSRTGAAERKKRGDVRPFTRVLMNPPFRVSEPERAFVDHAIAQMSEGGLLFAVLPNGAITGKSEAFWRREVLRNHTVRAVVRLPSDLFQPYANKGTYALILEAWRKHHKDDLVFFGYLHDDRTATRKSKLIGPAQAVDNMERITHELAAFIGGDSEAVTERPKESCVSELRLSGSCDWASESYLPNEPIAPSGPEGLFIALTRQSFRQPPKPTVVPDSRSVSLDALLEITRGAAPALKRLPAGNVPVITTKNGDNGIAGYMSVEPLHVCHNAVTISANGSGGRAHWHPYDFAATADVLVCELLPLWPSDPALFLHVCNEINGNDWRFDYYRKCSEERLLADVRVNLPMRGDRINMAHIRREIGRLPGYDALITLLKGRGE